MVYQRPGKKELSEIRNKGADTLKGYFLFVEAPLRRIEIYSVTKIYCVMRTKEVIAKIKYSVSPWEGSQVMRGYKEALLL